MDATIVVKPQEEDVALTPEAAVAAAMDQLFRLDLVGRALPLILKEAEAVQIEPGVHEVAAGTGDGRVEVVRFFPQTITIRAGEAVRWVNADPESPHNVVFYPGGTPPAPGQPLPPEVPEGFNQFMVVPGETYSGAEFINSGVMWNEARFQPLSVGDSFRLQFTTTGIYQYVCSIHSALNMAGTIVVVE